MDDIASSGATLGLRAREVRRVGIQQIATVAVPAIIARGCAVPARPTPALVRYGAVSANTFSVVPVIAAAMDACR